MEVLNQEMTGPTQGLTAGEGLTLPGRLREAGGRRGECWLIRRDRTPLSLMESLLKERAWRMGKNSTFSTDRANPFLVLLLPAVTWDPSSKLFKSLLPQL